MGNCEYIKGKNFYKKKGRKEGKEKLEDYCGREGRKTVEAKELGTVLWNAVLQT